MCPEDGGDIGSKEMPDQTIPEATSKHYQRGILVSLHFPEITGIKYLYCMSSGVVLFSHRRPGGLFFHTRGRSRVKTGTVDNSSIRSSVPETTVR